MVKRKENTTENTGAENTAGGSKKEMSNSIFVGLILLGISVLCMLILFGAFGTAGDYVNRYFFLGIFGFSSYGIAVALFVVAILKIFRVKVKVSLGMTALYLGTLAVVVMMCHLATSYGYAYHGWGGYISDCYLNADTAGGALFSLLGFPLVMSEFMYIFSMVILGLVAAGLAALIVVCMFNLDKIVAARRASKLGKITSSDEYSRRAEDGYRTVGTDMYNGTVSGKKLESTFRTTFINHPTNVKPIDKLADEEQDIIEDEPVPDVKPVVDMYRNMDSASAREVLYGDRDSAPKRPERRSFTRDDGMRMLYGDYTPQDDSPAAPAQDTGRRFTGDESLFYNETRERTRRENIAKLNSASDDEIDKFISNAFRRDNGAAEENKPAVEDADGERQRMQDMSDHNERAFDDFSQLFGMRVEEQSKPEPVKPEPVKPEAVKPEPVKPEPVKPEPVKPEPVKPEPVKPELVKPEPVKPEPVKPEPVKPEPVKPEPVKPEPVKPEPVKPVPAKTESSAQAKAEEEKDDDERCFNGIPIFVPEKAGKYTPPKLELLDNYNENPAGDEDYMTMTAELERTLEDFKVPAKVVNIVKGPAFSRFELQMPRSISVREIPKLEEDIRACLMVDSIRIEAPIRGKNLVGVEVPNKVRGTVGLKTVVNSPEFIRADKDKGLYFALGKDIDNNNYVCDITKFPHALVAGSSGSGKSVFLNCLLCSMVYKYSPDDLRVLLIDPKVVEFKPYEGMPHMLLPKAISDEHMAINALKWLVNEMEYRYNLFGENMVSNLSEYNAKNPGNKLPSILLIVDEVGDIMTSPVGRDFEQYTKRLAQKARAAGISMILATQRPSVDVITGTIKANLPTRIAFAVTSSVDSKTILDSPGAEKLLRLGDMLYKEGSKPNMIRVQGALILSKEIYAVANYVKEHNKAHFDPAIEKYICTVEEEKPASTLSDVGETHDGAMAEDPYFVQALKYVVEMGSVSISRLQRVFSLGYNRAARIVDKMEAKGYVEPQIAGKKDRAVLLTMEQFNELYGGDDKNG